jgi:hypothetical protein
LDRLLPVAYQAKKRYSHPYEKNKNDASASISIDEFSGGGSDF